MVTGLQIFKKKRLSRKSDLRDAIKLLRGRAFKFITD
jgi:hypothetical protein